MGGRYSQPPDVPKQQLVIVYCRSGSRSNRAAGILESLGYTRVVDFGGIYRWEGELNTGE
ncbi:MAG: rhodanese-like domain-containing protein [Spirochaetota bacterium]